MSAPKIRKVLDRSYAIQDDTVEDFTRLMAMLHENIGRRIAASLGVDPDSVFAPDGHDGRLVGRTAFEQLLQETSDPDAVRAIVMSAGLDDIEDFVGASGSTKAIKSVTDAVSKLAGLAEDSLVAQGLAAKGVLDTVAAEALISSYITSTLDETLRQTINRTAAVKIRQGLVSNMGMLSTEEVARMIADEIGVSLPRATTEARTQLAAADRFVQETTRRAIDPDGTKLLLAYIGPNDKVTRPFCKHLHNKAFTLEDFNAARNGQTAVHPRISGGGYNCRHEVLAVKDNPKLLKGLGLTKGTIKDILEANRLASGTKKTKGKKRRR